MVSSQTRQEILRALSQPSSGVWSPPQWQNLANKVYRYQIRNNDVFRKWCLWKTKKSSTAKHTFFRPRLAPSLPIVAFKETSVRSFHSPQKTLYFESSGTTNRGDRTVSRHYFRSLDLYKASVI